MIFLNGCSCIQCRFQTTSPTNRQTNDTNIFAVSIMINNKIINDIYHWWIYVQCATKCPVNGSQARTKPLSLIEIWIPLPPKCNDYICLWYMNTWSANCFKRTHRNSSYRTSTHCTPGKVNPLIYGRDINRWMESLDINPSMTNIFTPWLLSFISYRYVSTHCCVMDWITHWSLPTQHSHVTAGMGTWVCYLRVTQQALKCS